MALQRSQGGVEFPTGGICMRTAGARERSAQTFVCVEVSRSGAMPEPTVTVRMKEIA